MTKLYGKIGGETVRDIIHDFYHRAFEDPIIGHFFFGKDKEKLITLQIQFVCGLLEGTEHTYKGQPLRPIHAPLSIRRPHFDRRQRILEECHKLHGVDPQLSKEWLDREEALRSKIYETTR